VEEKWSIINLLWADIHNLICEVDMNNKLSVIRRNQNLFQIYSFLKEIWQLCFSSWDDIKNECYAAPCFGLKFFLQFSTECGRFKCVRWKTFGEFTTKWIAYTAGENRLVLKGAL